MRLAILGVSLCVACSSSTSSTPTNPFVGTWSCTVNESLTFTSPPNTAPQASTESVSVAVTSNADGTITGLTVTDGGPSCSIKYTTSGSTATLDGAQTCSPTDLSLDYTQGTVTVNGNAMTASLSFTFSGTAAAGDGGTAAVAGSGTTVYSCKK